MSRAPTCSADAVSGPRRLRRRRTRAHRLAPGDYYAYRHSRAPDEALAFVRLAGVPSEHGPRAAPLTLPRGVPPANEAMHPTSDVRKLAALAMIGFACS